YGRGVDVGLAEVRVDLRLERVEVCDHAAAAYRVDDVVAERAVALELRLAVHLVARGLVREGWVRLGVVEHVGRLAAVDVRLDVDDGAVDRALAIPLLVADRSDGAVLLLEVVNL